MAMTKDQRIIEQLGMDIEVLFPFGVGYSDHSLMWNGSELIGKKTVGKAFGCLEDDSDVFHALAAWEQECKSREIAAKRIMNIITVMAVVVMVVLI